MYIYGKDNLIKFQKIIGFLHPEKKAKLDEAIKSYIDYTWHFPNNNNLKNFIVCLIKTRAHYKKPNILRITSIYKCNLIELKKHLNTLFKINSKIYDRKNGLGNKYYELAIYGKSNLSKLENYIKLNP